MVTSGERLGGDWNVTFYFFHMSRIIIPTDELIFFNRVAIPPTRIVLDIIIYYPNNSSQYPHKKFDLMKFSSQNDWLTSAPPMPPIRKAKRMEQEQMDNFLRSASGDEGPIPDSWGMAGLNDVENVEPPFMEPSMWVVP